MKKIFRSGLILGMMCLAWGMNAAEVQSGSKILGGLAREVLSNDQVTSGLKEALGKGVQHAITSLSSSNGFLTNVNVKITLPEKLAPVEKTLRALNQGYLVDECITNMNHAAEQGVRDVGPIFQSAITNMTIEDVHSILNGPDDAATRYFRKASEERLREHILPIIQKTTESAGATKAYKQMLDKSQFGSALFGKFRKNPLDLDGYVTDKTMDGLFKMVAEKEKSIRQNPMGETSDLLQKVFGNIPGKK